jgi:hypothetical protein
MKNRLRSQEPREQRSCNTDTNYYGDRVCTSTPDDPTAAPEPREAGAESAASDRTESRDAVTGDSAETAG